MKSRPILFSGQMIRALLDGSKTQTRRICKPAQAESLSYVVDCPYGQWGDEDGDVLFKSPYGVLGDQLWVRETHRPIFGQTCGLIAVDYRADPEEKWGRMRDSIGRPDWTPSIHMRREYSRITLEIVSVRVERLQDISEADAWAEGIGPRYGSGEPFCDHPIAAYRELWESINGAGSWASNPWVWAVEFRKL